MEKPKDGQEFGKLKVMLAVTNSLESKAAVCWAVENLICKEDWVLLYHTVKTPHLIPTAIGMVPFAGASPAMQAAHIQVATQDAAKLLAQLEAYCKSKKIFPKTAVDRCDRRKDGIVGKVKAEGITHLVMGVKTPSKFSFKSWGPKKKSLTDRVCKEVSCHVTLVDKKKRSTFHSKVAAIEQSASPQQQGSLPLASQGPEIEDGSRALPLLSRRLLEKGAAIETMSEGEIRPDTAASSLFSVDEGLSQESSEVDEIKRVLPDGGAQLSKERPQLAPGRPPLSPRRTQLSPGVRQLSPLGGQSPRRDTRLPEGEPQLLKDTDLQFEEGGMALNRPLLMERPKSARVFYMSPSSTLDLEGQERGGAEESGIPSEEISEIPGFTPRSPRRNGFDLELPKSHLRFEDEARALLAARPATCADSSRKYGSLASAFIEKLPALVIDSMPQPSPADSPTTPPVAATKLASMPATWSNVSPRRERARPPRSSPTQSPLCPELISPSVSKMLLQNQVETPRFREQDDVIAQLWEQVEKLREINVLRDQEILAAATRAQRAEQQAQEREKAIKQEKHLREMAELKASRFAVEMHALKPPAHPGKSPKERTGGYKKWADFSGGDRWTISEK